MNELSLDEMEDVNGGGIKEIVAATTLAAMAMTGNTVSAFGLANAMAEENNAHIEFAPEHEDEVFSEVFEESAMMAEEIELTGDLTDEAASEEAASPEETESEEAGDAEEEAPEQEEADLDEAADAETDAAAEGEYVMNVGEVSRIPVSAIAAAVNAPIDASAIEGVGIVDESTADQFNVVREGGELFIHPKQDIDRLEVGLVAGDQIEVVTLENIQLGGATVAALNAFSDISGSVEKEAKKQAKAWAKRGIAALCQMIPEGQFCAPVFQSLFDYLTADDPAPDKLALISAQLGEIRDEVKAEAEAIRRNTANVTTLAGYGHYLDLLNTSCTKVMMNLKTYGEANLPENDKMVLIASLLTELDSDKVDNLFGYILMEAAAFNGTSAVSSDGRDLFQVAYDLCVPKAIFSGEALDMSKDYVRMSVNHFTASYSVATTCLEAYMRVFDFTEDDVVNLGDAAKEKYTQLCKVPGTIYNAIETLNTTILGKGGAMEHYDDYKWTWRFTLINKGKANIKLDRNVDAQTHKEYGDYDLVGSALKSQPISDEHARAIAEQAVNVYKTTPYKYLRNIVGFDMPNLDASVKSYLPGKQSMETVKKTFRSHTTTNRYYQGYVGNEVKVSKEKVHFYSSSNSSYFAGRPIIFKLFTAPQASVYGGPDVGGLVDPYQDVNPATGFTVFGN